MTWQLEPGTRTEQLGLLPLIFQPGDTQSAVRQAGSRYRHGGGWLHFDGFEAFPDRLVYPGEEPDERDESYPLQASLYLPHSQETVRVYANSWVAVWSHAGDCITISRMD